MKVSTEGIKFITGWEGLRLEAYKCEAGVWTIGYGSTMVDGQPVKEGDILPGKWAAEQEFALDLMRYELAVNNYVKVPLKRHQFDALVSLCYNVGVVAFGKSTLVEKINQKDYAGACGEFAKWDNIGANESKGLENRRVAEIALFAKELNT